jgi:hypothetical protein
VHPHSSWLNFRWPLYLWHPFVIPVVLQKFFSPHFRLITSIVAAFHLRYFLAFWGPLSSISLLAVRFLSKLPYIWTSFTYFSIPKLTAAGTYRNVQGRVSKQVTNGSKTAVIDVISFLCVSLGSSIVQLHGNLGSRRACACSETGFCCQNGYSVWGLYYRRAVFCCPFFFFFGQNSSVERIFIKKWFLFVA